MGMLDNQAKFSVAQAVTSTGDTASTNVYGQDFAAASDFGLADAHWINAVVNTTFTSGGSATIQAVLQDSADNSTFADVLAGPVVPVASATAGAVLLQACPPLGLRQYIRIAYRVATAAMTAGKVDAYISSDVQRNIARPSGFTVQ